MIKQVKNLKHFQSEIDSALSLITNKRKSLESVAVPKNGMIAGTESLLERCHNVVNRQKNKKPVLRVVHHLACSGGTLISKCISAMPNVYLLSESHPYTATGVSVGTDIPALVKHAGIPNYEDLASTLFKQSISTVYNTVEAMGGTLVLRDHTHSDFSLAAEPPKKSATITLLEKDYEIRSILTVRNPIDSYSSLVRNGWVKFQPATFEEYCRRLLLLVSQYSPEQIYSYEEFLCSPQEQMKLVSKALQLPFDESFEDTFGIFTVTGDSGRSGDVIGERSRIAPEQIITESKHSKSFSKLKALNLFDWS